MANNVDSSQFKALISHFRDTEFNYLLTLPEHQLESILGDKSFQNDSNRVLNKEVWYEDFFFTYFIIIFLHLQLFYDMIWYDLLSNIYQLYI